MTWPTLPNWQDAPSTATPLDASNLDIVNTSIEDVEAAVGNLQPEIPFTAVQTTSYTASANQYVLTSTASGSLTVTLPTAPPNETVVGAKMVALAGSNTTTIQLGGSDTFDVVGGSQTATLKTLDQAGVWQYNSATAVWIRTSDDLSLTQLDARYVASLTAADSSITVSGTATAPTVKVAQANLTFAQSQVTGLPVTLANSAQPGGIWDFNMFADLASNMSRDDGITGILLATGTRTQLMMIGLCPAGSYSVVRLCVALAGTGSAFTAALYGSTSLTSTSWARLGSGNITPSATALGVSSTSLAFTLSVPTYVMLQLVVTTASTYPTMAGSVSQHSTLINPVSGTPIVATSTGSTAPGTTLNPTTGFTNSASKIWCALA